MFSRNKKYILDGGTGQTLLEKGLKPEGTLWSATALINEDFHDLVVETHLDFIKAGADLIVTNNFGVRKRRLLQNNRLDYFESANKFAGQLAQKSKELSNKNILIAGSLPTHADTYQSRFFNTDEEVHQVWEIVGNALDRNGFKDADGELSIRVYDETLKKNVVNVIDKSLEVN